MTPGQAERAHLTFKAVRLNKRCPQFSIEFRPRVHGLVCESETEGDTFIQLASGMALPPRGEVKWGDLIPAKNPALRAKIGSLFSEEPHITSAKTVRSYLTHVLNIRHKTSADSPPSPEHVPLVSSLLELPASHLDNRKRRLLALGLSLALTDPSLLILYDPLRGLDGPATDFTLKTLQERAAAGAIVVCVTPTFRAASLLSDKVHTLYRTAPVQTASYFVVRCERPREVASLLAQQDSIFFTKILPSKDLIVGSASGELAAGALTAALAVSQVEVYEVRHTHDAAELLRDPQERSHA